METIYNNSVFEAELSLSKRIIERFIGSCSHELKSPLCSIEGLVDIASKYTVADEVQTCHEMINKCLANMKKMLYSLEEYTSHLQRELQRDKIEASGLVHKILGENASDIYDSGVIVNVDIDQQTQWISDEYSNYTILTNIIRNAIIFNDDKKPVKTVRIKISVEQTGVEVQVQDNGIGISADQRSRLFEPFHRGTMGNTGFGLGLFLVKALVNRLRAKFCLKSEENLGTTVKLLIQNQI
jgi:signal transduction histidine kinase